MTPFIRIVLVAFSVAITAAAAHFVVGYGGIELNNAARLEIELPTLATFMARFSPWFYAVPLILGAAGLITLRKRWHVECVVLVAAIGILFAIVWPLLCIYAFRLPYEIIGT